MLDVIEIGKIKSVHGAKKLKIINFIDPESFSSISKKNGLMVGSGAFRIKTVSFYKNYAIAEPLDAENLSGLVGESLFTKRSFFPQELLPMDLVGMDVFEKKFLKKPFYGKVVDVKDFGGGILIEVLQKGKDANKSELYLFDESRFPHVNTKKGYVLLKKPKTRERVFY